jgi:GTP:adenosylcobinamide-phosphate guanylyltransferase
MKAVITAGGRIDGAFAGAAGTAVKALAPVRGESMLARVIAALRGAGASRIAVVGGSEVRAACGTSVDRFVDESPSGSQNILRALGAWPEDGEPLVYATSDLPYVTAAATREFLKRVPSGAVAISLTESADFATRFPGAPPAGITLAGERVVNGGVFSIPAGSAERLALFTSRFFEARKRPWRMASFVSPFALVAFFLGRLSIARLEQMATHALGVPSAAVRGCPPELAFDADTAAEYSYACAHA